MATRRRLIMSLIMCSVMLMMVAVSVIGVLSAVNSSHNLDGTITYASNGNINFDIEEGVNASIGGATFIFCSEVKEKIVEDIDGVGYGYTHSVMYDACNPFGMIAGEFGDIEDLSKHLNKTLPEEMVFNDFNSSYNNVMDSGINYNNFRVQVINLHNNLFKASALDNAFDNSAIIGLNYSSVIAPDTSLEFNWQYCVDDVANLFDFNTDEFIGYAQDLADIYAQHRVNPTYEALDNGCVDTGELFIFPIYIENAECNIMTYVIIDNAGRVSIWISDIDDLDGMYLWNYSDAYGPMTNRSYCYNEILWSHDNKLNYIDIYPNEEITNLDTWKHVKLPIYTDRERFHLAFNVTNRSNDDYEYDGLVVDSYLGIEITSFDFKSTNINMDATINVVGGADKFILTPWETKQIVITFDKINPDEEASIDSFNLNIKLTKIEPNLPKDWCLERYMISNYGQYYYQIQKGTSSLPENLIIPSYINGVRVTEIIQNTFAGQNIKSVYIPKSIEKIGNYAFENCLNLKEVYIPASVTSIGVAPFRGCSGLESIKVDYDNTVYHSKLNSKDVADNAYGKYIKDIAECNAIIRYEDTLIQGCKNSVMPIAATTTLKFIIEEYAFAGSGILSIDLTYVTHIGSYAFNASGLTTITTDGTWYDVSSRYRWEGSYGGTACNMQADILNSSSSYYYKE